MFWEGEAPAEPNFCRARVYPVPTEKCRRGLKPRPTKDLDFRLTGKFASLRHQISEHPLPDLTEMGIRHKLFAEVKGHGIRASRLGFGGT